jgi:crotonobetainyl-CoA:carnitine CoA-transferase CaiB-like acyl-CoA transferase
MMQKLPAGPLAGIRVVDLTRVIAGPLATQILGDLGADVIKIERPDGGDDVRHVGPPWMPQIGDEHQSTYFQAVNRNKRSIALSFEKEEGRALVRKLVADADIIVENFRPGTLDRYGLGFEHLRAVNPRLVYCSVSGFGQSGPYAGRSGYDYLAQGMTGLMNVTGHPAGEAGGGPMRVGVPLVDIFAGMNAGLGILAALRHRDATGEGQHVDISLFDSGLASMLNPVAAWFNARAEIGLTSNDHPSAAPYGIFPVDDGYIIIATFSDREFVRLAAALGHPEWSTDPRYARNAQRVEHRGELKALIEMALGGRGKHEWVALLNAATVSCGPLNTMEDIAQDPHVQHRGLIATLEHDTLGPIHSAASPLRLSASPVSYRIAPPLPGEHTDAVLRELGLNDAERARLESDGIVRPPTFPTAND